MGLNTIIAAIKILEKTVAIKKKKNIHIHIHIHIVEYYIL